jgi:hypothetical protein
LIFVNIKSKLNDNLETYFGKMFTGKEVSV